MRGQGPGRTSAVQLEDDLILVFSQGTSALFEPNGTDPREVRSWRPRWIQDTSGNTVEFTYDPDGAPTVVHFGGRGDVATATATPQLDPDYPHTGKVEFFYSAFDDVDEVVVSHGDGVTRTYAKRIDHVLVHNRRVESANDAIWYERIRYDFEFGDVPDVVEDGQRGAPLVAIHEQVGNPPQTREAIRFEYSEDEGLSTGGTPFVPFGAITFSQNTTRTGRLGAQGAVDPFDLSTQEDRDDVARAMSRQFSSGDSYTLQSLADVDRDGLRDLLIGLPQHDDQPEDTDVDDPFPISEDGTTQLIPLADTSPMWRYFPARWHDEPGGPVSLAFEPTSLDPLDTDWAYDPFIVDDTSTAVTSLEASTQSLTSSVPLDPYSSVTLTRRMMIDVDGDGAADIVEAFVIPEVVNPYSGTTDGEPDPVDLDYLLDFGVDEFLQYPSKSSEDYVGLGTVPTEQFGASVPRWRVRFAQSNGEFTLPIILVAPAAFPRASIASDLCTSYIPGTSPARDKVFNPSVITPIDINGDGLLDIVRFPVPGSSGDPWSAAVDSRDGDILVAYGKPILHTLRRDPEAIWDVGMLTPSGEPADQDGWTDWEVLASPTSSVPDEQDLAFALLSDGWQRPVIDEDSFDLQWDALDDNGPATEQPGFYRPSCKTQRTIELARFEDINGDGLVDFVQSEVPHSGALHTVGGDGWAPPLVDSSATDPGRTDGTFDWKVFYGLGDGKFSAPQPWSVPVQLGLAESMEASPSVQQLRLPSLSPEVWSSCLEVIKEGMAFPDDWTRPGGDSQPGVEGSPSLPSECALLSGPQSFFPGAVPPRLEVLSNLVADVLASTASYMDDQSGGATYDDFTEWLTSWQSVTPETIWDFANSSSVSVVGLRDVNHDGLKDLVVTTQRGGTGDFTWFRNTGSGFAPATCGGAGLACPEAELYEDGLDASLSAVQPLMRGASHDFPDWADVQTLMLNAQVLEVGDFNGDGVPDKMSGIGASETHIEGSIRFGSSGAQRVLTRVLRRGGAEEAFAYVPSSTIEPAGRPGTNRAAAADARRDLQGRMLLSAIETIDRVTQSRAWDLFDYADGECEDGVCRGFAETTSTTCAPKDFRTRFGGRAGFSPNLAIPSDPDCDLDGLWLTPGSRTLDSARGDQPSGFDGGPTGALLVSKTRQTHALLRDGPLVLTSEITTDRHHRRTDLPPPGGSGPALDVTYRSTTLWGDVSVSPADDCTDDSTHCRVLQRDLEFFGDLGEVEYGATPAPYVTVEYDYTAEGDLVGVLTTGENDLGPVQPHQKLITWEVDPDDTWALPVAEETIGWDAFNAVTGVLESVVFEYDGALTSAGTRGLMVGQFLCGSDMNAVGASPDCSSPTALADAIEWSFTRHERGQVEAIDGPRRDTMSITAWRYGGTIAGRIVNGEGHDSGQLVNERGDIWKQRDPANVIQQTDFDDWGRPIARWVKGVGGTDFVQTEAITYFEPDDPLDRNPSYRLVERFDQAIGGAPIPAGRTVEVFDGFGQIAQTWTTTGPDDPLGGEGPPLADNYRWVLQDSVHDVFGQLRFTSRPYVVSPMVPPPDPRTLASEGWMEVLQYDSHGLVRVHYSDVTYDPTCATVTHEFEQGIVLHRDESGRTKELHHDALGRLLTVKEGGPTPGPEGFESCMPPSTPPDRPITVTGQYRYDGMGRLQMVEDSVPGSAAQTVAGMSGNRHWYEYDLAGRLRRVHRDAVSLDPLAAATCSGDPQPPSLTRETIASYEYLGNDGLPVARYEGPASDPANLVTQWFYDDMGRVTRKAVRPHDHNPATWPATDWAYWDVYEWHWDARWTGAKNQSASYHADGTQEVTEFYYQDFRPTAGNLGHLSGVARDFGTLAPEVVSLTFVNNLRGQPLETTYPSGSVVKPVLGHGVTLGHDVVTPAYPSAPFEIRYGFDEYGLPDGWLDRSGHAAVSQLVERDSPRHVGRVAWDRGLVEDPLEMVLGWGPDLRLLSRDLARSGLGGQVTDPALDGFLGMTTYQYDPLGRLTALRHRLPGLAYTAGADETYTYDVMGSVTAMTRKDRDATYPAVPEPMDVSTYVYGPNHAAVARCDTGAAWEEVGTYDRRSGRLTALARYENLRPIQSCGTAHCGKTPAWTKSFHYDGTGQLARLDVAEGVSATSVWWYHDLGDALTRRLQDTGSGVKEERYLEGWQWDVKPDGTTVRTVEQLLPMLKWVIDPTVTAATGEPVFEAKEGDGHALYQFDLDGELVSADLRGAYGLALVDGIDGAPTPPLSVGHSGLRDLSGFHGMDQDPVAGAVRMGVRHMLLTGDGRWAQPEPLLHMNPANLSLWDPGSAVGAIAAGDPVRLADRSGYKVTATHEVDAGKDTVNQSLGEAGKVEIEANGNMTIEKGENYDDATDEQKALFAAISDAIASQELISIEFVADNDVVLFDNYGPGQIDIADVVALDDGAGPASSQATLHRLFVEQRLKEEEGIDHDAHHLKASESFEMATGWSLVVNDAWDQDNSQGSQDRVNYRVWQGPNGEAIATYARIHKDAGGTATSTTFKIQTLVGGF